MSYIDGKSKQPVVKKTPTPPPAPVPIKKVQPARRPSTSVPTIRRSETEAVVSARPKREIHPPPPKDLPYADAPKKSRKGKSMKDDGTVEQLRFCAKVLQELHRKAYYAVANPFYEPVGEPTRDTPSKMALIDCWSRLREARLTDLPQGCQEADGPIYDEEEAGLTWI
jgi:bromodomain-containing factor 1